MNRYEYDWFRWHIQVCIASICKHLCWPMWWSRYIYSTPLSKITVTPWTKGLWFQSLITWTRFDVDKQLCGTKQLPSQFITVQFFSAWTRLIIPPKRFVLPQLPLMLNIVASQEFRWLPFLPWQALSSLWSCGMHALSAQNVTWTPTETLDLSDSARRIIIQLVQYADVRLG